MNKFRMLSVFAALIASTPPEPQASAADPDPEPLPPVPSPNDADDISTPAKLAFAGMVAGELLGIGPPPEMLARFAAETLPHRSPLNRKQKRALDHARRARRRTHAPK